jgi:RNA polymerase sigma-70 factor (ECF subfamily)
MSGDRAAFSAIVTRYQGMVHRLCRRYLASEADDLAQETFVRAFVERERYDPSYPIAPWLATLARRLCLDRLRRKKPEPGSHDVAVASPDSDVGAERRASARQQLMHLEHAVNALPEGPREAFWLYHHEGLPYAEIARVLGVPPGTVMTWLHRARLRLSTALSAAEVQNPSRRIAP